MNKGELAAAVAQKTNLSKDEAASAVDAVFDVIADRLSAGEEVRVLGFGNFSVAQRAASTGRDPRTGAPIRIKSSKQAKFRPGEKLRSALHGDPTTDY